MVHREVSGRKTEMFYFPFKCLYEKLRYSSFLGRTPFRNSCIKMFLFPFDFKMNEKHFLLKKEKQ